MNYLKNNWFVLLFAIVVLIVSSFPTMNKELFVGKDGNIKLIGSSLSLILALCIIGKWKHVKGLFYFMFLSCCIADIAIFLGTYGLFRINISILFLLHFGLLLIFRYSKRINEYLFLRY